MNRTITSRGGRAPRVPGHRLAGDGRLAAAGDPDIADKLKKGYTAGAKKFKNHLDGYNQLPYLTGQEPKGRRNMVWYFSDEFDLLAVRYGNWKLHFPHDYISTTPDNVGGDSRPGNPATKKIELALFDLEADRNETTNVADQHADVVARVTALADKARADLGDSATKQVGSRVRKAGMVE